MKTATRKKPGKTETRLSLAVLALLVIVGAGVFMRQYQTNPAVTARRPEAQQSTPIENTQTQALIDTVGSGIVPVSAPQSFGPQTLYEKINGRADLYLSSGFVALDAQRFSLEPAAGDWVEVFVYDMGAKANAFSVFSMQRRQDARTDDRGFPAYRTANALFMTHDRFYLEMVGSREADPLNQAMGTLADAFVAAHGGKAQAQTRAPGAERFPQANLESDSLRLIGANAFGFEQLDRIHTADYLIDGQRMTAFVSERPDAQAAVALAENYRRILVSYGAVGVDAPGFPQGAVVLQLFDTFEVVFSRGRALVGIHEAVNLEVAGVLAGRLAAHLDR